MSQTKKPTKKDLPEENKQVAEVAISPVVLATSFMRALFQYLKLAEIHDPSNAIFDVALVEVSRLIEQIMKGAGQAGLHLAFRGEIVFLNGKSIRPKARQFHIYKYLVKFFQVRGLSSFRTLTYPEPKNLKTFLWAVTDSKEKENPFSYIREKLSLEGIRDFEIEAINRVGGDAGQQGEDEQGDSTTSDIELVVSALYNRLLKFTQVCFENRKLAKEFKLAPPQGTLQELVLLADEDLHQMFRLVSIKRYERPLPYQAVNSAFLMVSWGRALRLPMNVVVELAGAALAHPLAVMSKAEMKADETEDQALLRLVEELKDTWPLTDLQRLSLFEWVKMHGRDGVYVCGARQTKCYPHFFSRMVRILALFEAMTTYRKGKRVFLPDEALAELMQSEGLVDKTLAKLFVNWLGVYPLGSLVQLQSGEIAQVFATGSDPLRFQRPMVMVLKDPEGQIVDRPYLIDLAEMSHKLGVYKKSIRRSITVDEAKIPEEKFQLRAING